MGKGLSRRARGGQGPRGLPYSARQGTRCGTDLGAVKADIVEIAIGQLAKPHHCFTVTAPLSVTLCQFHLMPPWDKSFARSNSLAKREIRLFTGAAHGNMYPILSSAVPIFKEALVVTGMQ